MKLIVASLSLGMQQTRIMRTCPLSLSLLVCLVSAPAAVQAQPFDMSINCKRVELKGGNTYEMSQCAGRANEELKTQMEGTLKSLRALMNDDSERRVLADSQALWSKWKIKEADLCARSMGYSPEGSGYGMQWGYCAAGMIRARTDELRRYLREIQSRR